MLYFLEDLLFQCCYFLETFALLPCYLQFLTIVRCDEFFKELWLKKKLGILPEIQKFLECIFAKKLKKKRTNGDLEKNDVITLLQNSNYTCLVSLILWIPFHWKSNEFWLKRSNFTASSAKKSKIAEKLIHCLQIPERRNSLNWYRKISQLVRYTELCERTLFKEKHRLLHPKYSTLREFFVWKFYR